MKKTFITVGICIASIIILDRFLSYIFMNYIFPKALSGESGGTINYVIHNKGEMDFLVLGASRAKHGINPDKLFVLGGRGHNLGINATTPLYHLLLMDLLVQSGVTPKRIILQTDLYTYGQDNKEEIKDQIKRMYHYDTPLVASYVREQGFIERVRYSSHLYRLNRKALNIIVNAFRRSAVTVNNGFVGLAPSPYVVEIKPLAESFVYDSTSQNSKALQKIKAIARENNIELIIVLAPFYNNVFFNKEEHKKFLSSIQQGDGVYVIDMSDINKWPALSNPSLWRDPTHFNNDGAELFSQILNKEIFKLLNKNN